MKFKNIVFVQLTGSRGKGGTGGGLEFYERLAKFLLKKNRNVFAITNNLDDLGFAFLEKQRFSADFRRATGRIRSFFLYDSGRLKEQVGGICSKLDLDKSVFVTVDPFPIDIAGVRILRKLGVKHIVITMYHITPSPLWHSFRRGFSRVFPAWIISVNAMIATKFLNIPIFLDNPRIAKATGWHIDRCLSHPLSLDNYNKISPENRERNIVFMGRVSYNKGIIDLLKAWQIIVKNSPGSKLILIGSNFISNKLEKLLLKYSIEESVEIKGYVSNEEKNQILESSSILLFPSYEEGWALSVMEAVDQGVLPITYDLPAYDYLGHEAVKIKPGYINGLAEAAIYYLKYERERKEKVRAIQNEISKYTIDFVADHWISQLESMNYD